MKTLKNTPGWFTLSVSGKDAPGITAEITQHLAQNLAQIHDISQSVHYGHLSLTLLCSTPGLFGAHGKSKQESLFKNLVFNAHQKGLQISIKPETQKSALAQLTQIVSASHRKQFAVTLLGDTINPDALGRVATLFSEKQINIDTIRTLSQSNPQVIELGASTAKKLGKEDIRASLLNIASQEQIDIGFQEEDFFRRSKRLVVFDMDSTLIQNEVIDELAREKGVFEEVSALTSGAMKGALSFQESLRLRSSLLKGLPVTALKKVQKRIQVTPGAVELIGSLKRLGLKTAVISGGFRFVADRLQKELGLDYAFANDLEIKNEKLTGRLVGKIIDATAKADLVEKLAIKEDIDLKQVIAVGDGANDLLMLKKAGLGIAFNAKPVLRKNADLALNQKDLRPILYLLGFTNRELR